MTASRSEATTVVRGLGQNLALNTIPSVVSGAALSAASVVGGAVTFGLGTVLSLAAGTLIRQGQAVRVPQGVWIPLPPATGEPTSSIGPVDVGGRHRNGTSMSLLALTGGRNPMRLTGSPPTVGDYIIRKALRGRDRFGLDDLELWADQYRILSSPSPIPGRTPPTYSARGQFVQWGTWSLYSDKDTSTRARCTPAQYEILKRLVTQDVAVCLPRSQKMADAVLDGVRMRLPVVYVEGDLYLLALGCAMKAWIQFAGGPVGLVKDRATKAIMSTILEIMNVADGGAPGWGTSHD